MKHISERDDFLQDVESHANAPDHLEFFSKRVMHGMELQTGISRYHKYVVLATMINALEIDFQAFAVYYSTQWANS